jgi:hypothetical protein
MTVLEAELIASSAAAPSSRQTSRAILALALLVLGIVNWLFSLPLIDPDSLGGLGLIAILPPGMLLAYLFVIAGFALTLSRELVRTPAPALLLAALVVLLHLTPAIAYETLRYSWAWKHIGVIDFIMRTGELDPVAQFLSAYHNWPGFFLGFAGIASTFSLDALEIANLARFYPTALNLALIPALAFLLGNFTSDRRLIWLAVGLFLVANWIGQDYFSPQGTVYLFHVLLLGLLTGPLALARGQAKATLPHVGRYRWIAVPPALLLILAIVSSHQITPLFLLASLAALALFRRISWGYLIFTGVAETMWLLFFAQAFIAPEMAGLLAEFGRFSDETLGRMADLNQVSADQRIVSIASRVLTGLLAVAALLGVVRRLLAGHFDLTPALLMLAPAPVLLATPYGGEIVFRLYLFAAPFLAFYAAAGFFPDEQSPDTPWLSGAAAVLLMAMAPMFLLANNGKDAQYRFSPAEVAAADWLYSNSQPGQLLVEGSRSYPSQFRNYENFTYVPLSEELPELRDRLLEEPERLLVRWLREAPMGGYIILTRSQKAMFDGMGLLPIGAMDALERRLIASPQLKVAYSNKDATVLTLNPAYRP